MPTAEYTVRIDAFEGPLDLLLFLIRRAEVDVHDIPIAAVTEQYLQYLNQFAGPEQPSGSPGPRIDIERAGEFLVMAATLMEIKSRMLAPPRPDTPSDEAAPTDAGRAAVVDPRADLVRQLLEYKRYRDAMERLDSYRHEWEHRFPAGRAGSPTPEPVAEEEDTGKVEIDDVDLLDLVEAFARIIQTVDLTRVGEHHVQMDDTPIELHAEDIVDRLKRHAAEALALAAAPDLDFAAMFKGRSRPEMIGLFLAMLELVRQRRVVVRQEADRGRIVITLGEPEVEPPTSGQPNAIETVP